MKQKQLTVACHDQRGAEFQHIASDLHVGNHGRSQQLCNFAMVGECCLIWHLGDNLQLDCHNYAFRGFRLSECGYSKVSHMRYNSIGFYVNFTLDKAF
jgi:hypothetical protein